MASVVDDLQYLCYGIDELDRYLLSKELFWPVTVYPIEKNHSYPKLTLGNMLLAVQRLEAFSAGKALQPAEESEFERIKTEMQAASRKWRVAWEEKAAHEYVSRLKQWAEVLHEIGQNRDKQGPFYSSDIRMRVLLALLEADVPEDDLPDIKPLDLNLRMFFEEGEFVWEPELMPGFPKEQFWFLYGGIRVD